MKGNLGLNRRMTLEDWAKQSEVTPEEKEAVRKRAVPIETGGDIYQETTLDRELEVVRVTARDGNPDAVLRSEAERSSVYVARQMEKMMLDLKQQQEQHNSQVTTLTNIVASVVPHMPVEEHMETKELARILGCGAANILRRLKAGTIPANLLLPGSDGKSRHRKFKRKETEAWVAKENQRRVPPRSKRPNGRK